MGKGAVLPMTSRIDAWGGNSFPLGGYIGGHDEAFDTAQIIADKSVSITVRRGSATTLGAQTVRLESLSSQREIMGDGGTTYLADAMALGYRGHPTIADTDLKPGDRFAVSGVSYQVIYVTPAQANTLQAFLQVRV